MQYPQQFQKQPQGKRKPWFQNKKGQQRDRQQKDHIPPEEQQILDQAQTNLQTNVNRQGFSPNAFQVSNVSKYDVNLRYKKKEVQDYQDKIKQAKDVPSKFHSDQVKKKQEQDEFKTQYFLEPQLKKGLDKEMFELRSQGVRGKIFYNLQTTVENLSQVFQTILMKHTQNGWSPQQILSTVKAHFTILFCQKIAFADKVNESVRSPLLATLKSFNSLKVPKPLIPILDQIGDFDSEYGRFVLKDKLHMVTQLLKISLDLPVLSGTNFDVLASHVMGQVTKEYGFILRLPTDRLQLRQLMTAKPEIVINFFKENEKQAVRFLLANLDEQYVRGDLFDAKVDEKYYQQQIGLAIQKFNTLMSQSDHQIDEMLETFQPTTSGTAAQLCSFDGSSQVSKSRFEVHSTDAYYAILLGIQPLIEYQETIQRTIPHIIDQQLI